MSAKNLELLQEEITELLRKYGFDGFIGIPFTGGMPKGGVAIYDPVDARTKAVIVGMNALLLEFYRKIPSASVTVTSGFYGNPEDKN